MLKKFIDLNMKNNYKIKKEEKNYSTKKKKKLDKKK